MGTVGLAGWKSDEGKNEFLEAYDAAMSLWPVPYESRSVDTRYGDTHVVVSGKRQAPPVVMFHAATGFGAIQWYPNAAQISERYRMYAVEFVGAAGKGRQTAPILTRADCSNWVMDVLDRLDLERPQAVGSSHGGWLGCNFALHHPERLQSMALLAPAASIARMRAVIRLSIRLGPLMPAWTGPATIKAMFGGRANLDQRVVDVLTLHLAHFRYQQKAVHPTPFPEDELRRLRPSLLLLIGEHEVIYDAQSTLARAARLIPAIEAELVPDAGHLINMERPEFASERLLRFFARRSRDSQEDL